MEINNWITLIVSPICILLGYVACILIKHKRTSTIEERAIDLMSQHFIAMKELTEKFADLSCQQFNQLHNAKLFEVMNQHMNIQQNPLEMDEEKNDLSDLLGAGQ